MKFVQNIIYNMVELRLCIHYFVCVLLMAAVYFKMIISLFHLNKQNHWFYHTVDTLKGVRQLDLQHFCSITLFRKYMGSLEMVRKYNAMFARGFTIDKSVLTTPCLLCSICLCTFKYLFAQLSRGLCVNKTLTFC